ncbi:MAG TPA: hypothetical protein VGK89_04350 [Candidatus Eisenbacteria bacterium]|jgi:hypothetical protein
MRKHYLSLVVCAMLAIGGLAVASAPALALTPYDPPTIECLSSTLNSITLKICAGPSGAPAGVTVQWITKADHDLYGWSNDALVCKLSLSGQPSLQHPGKSRWELLPGECESIIIGDINFDETGVSGEGCGLDALECGTDYVFRAFAHAGRGFGRSEFTDKLYAGCSTQPCPPTQCTHTQGYWKTHGDGDCHSGQNASVWPASALPMTLGTVSYTTAAKLCAIFNTPAGGNGLIALAHQLISAKLNLANGATSCAGLASAIASADALIGSKTVPPTGPSSCGSPCFIATSSTSALTLSLTNYNEGGFCVPNCHGDVQQGRATGAEPSRTATWGQLKTIYR